MYISGEKLHHIPSNKKCIFKEYEVKPKMSPMDLVEIKQLTMGWENGSK